MKKITTFTIALLISFGLGFQINSVIKKQSEITDKNLSTIKSSSNNLTLGAFSISMNVKDIKSSKQFYEHLGFKVFGGDLEKNYLIMKNENCLIGLFQGMFQGNMLTFNPGWDENAKNKKKFNDIREIQKHLKNQNIILTTQADENTSGPASITLSDPDGNVILIDQHR